MPKFIVVNFFWHVWYHSQIVYSNIEHLSNIDEILQLTLHNQSAKRFYCYVQLYLLIVHIRIAKYIFS